MFHDTISVTNAHDALEPSRWRRHTHTHRPALARLTHLAWNNSCQISSTWRSPGLARVVIVALLIDASSNVTTGVT